VAVGFLLLQTYAPATQSREEAERRMITDARFEPLNQAAAKHNFLKNIIMRTVLVLALLAIITVFGLAQVHHQLSM
jgi:hypothetical protein